MRRPRAWTSWIAPSPGERRNKATCIALNSRAKPGESKDLRASCFMKPKNNLGMMTMKALRLKWAWRARMLRFEHEARHAMREWLMV